MAIFKSHCYYARTHKSLIEAAIKYLPQYVFDCWHIQPTFEVIDSLLDDEEVQLIISYEDPNKHYLQIASDGRLAFDLAEAFVNGWLLAKGEFLD
jgi:hypothetical protein